MTKMSKHQQQGFSLLETLVAFAILVLVLSVIMTIIGNGSRSSRLTYDYSLAVLIAQSKLAEIQPNENAISGTELARFEWQVKRTEADYPDPGADNNYQRAYKTNDVVATVSWKSAGKKRQIQLETVQLVND